MNEEFNPYANQNENAPQPPFNQRPQYPQPPVQPPVQQAAPQPQQAYPARQTAQNSVPAKTTEERLAERKMLIEMKRRGQAKGYGITSLLIGCVATLATIMIVFNFQITNSDKWYWALTGSTFLSLPAVIFGVVALAKKPEKKMFAILGLTFAGVLVVTALVYYFVVANTGEHLYWFAQAKK